MAFQFLKFHNLCHVVKAFLNDSQMRKERTKTPKAPYLLFGFLPSLETNSLKLQGTLLVLEGSGNFLCNLV